MRAHGNTKGIDGGLLLVLALVVPLSVKLYAWRIDLELILPAELLIGCAAVHATLLTMRRMRRALMLLRSNVLAMAASAYFASQLASAAASVMPMVSVKALAVQGAYVAVFFVLPVLGASGVHAIRRALLAHAWVMVPLALWGAAGQVEGGFDRASAAFAMHPLYQDRTIFSAALSFGAIALMVHGFGPMTVRRPSGLRAAQKIGGMLLLMAVVFNYTRAAWLGLAASALVLALAFVGRRWHGRGLMLFALLMLPLALLVLNSSRLGETNASAHRTGLIGTLKSFANRTTDPTNMERLNRWSCAWRMFLDAPMLGHGPGTFQFVFPPYQRTDERTEISPPDTADLRRSTAFRAHGRVLIVRPGPKELEYSKGTAHSEYLLALSERGAIGALAWVLLLAVGLIEGWRAWHQGGDEGSRILAATAFFGLVAYGTHAFFNNYLDDCKVAMPFWLSLAAISCLRARGASASSG